MAQLLPTPGIARGQDFRLRAVPVECFLMLLLTGEWVGP